MAARKISIEEPNCQMPSAIRVPSAVLGLPSHAVLSGRPKKPRIWLMTPLGEKSCFHSSTMATLPPISEGI